MSAIPNSVSSEYSFRVWVEEDRPGHWAAFCLETGAVATADDEFTVSSMIEEVLISELLYAIDTNNFNNLYGSPAPQEIQEKWKAAARVKDPEVRIVPLPDRNPETRPPSTPKKSVVSTRIEKIAKAS